MNLHEIVQTKPGLAAKTQRQRSKPTGLMLCHILSCKQVSQRHCFQSCATCLRQTAPGMLAPNTSVMPLQSCWATLHVLHLLTLLLQLLLLRKILKSSQTMAWMLKSAEHMRQIKAPNILRCTNRHLQQCINVTQCVRHRQRLRRMRYQNHRMLHMAWVKVGNCVANMLHTSQAPTQAGLGPTRDVPPVWASSLS